MRRFHILAIITALVGLAVLTTGLISANAQDDLPWTATYYTTRDLSGGSITQQEAVINYDWSTGAPREGIPADNFSVRWSRSDTFEAGEYTFAARSDDGIRMYVDGELIIDEWTDRQFTWVAVQKNMAAGSHDIVVEFYEETGRAAIEAGYYPNFDVSSSDNDDEDDNEDNEDNNNDDNDDDDSDGSASDSSSANAGGTTGANPGSGSERSRTIQPLLFIAGNDPLPSEPPDGAIRLEDGVLAADTDPKYFTTQGFPGAALREDGLQSYSFVKNIDETPTMVATWNFSSGVDAYYLVYVYIPEGSNATTSASYVVIENGTSTEPVVVDQSALGGQWVRLGRYFFEAGQRQMLSLTNATEENAGTTEVLMDDVIFLFEAE